MPENTLMFTLLLVAGFSGPDKLPKKSNSQKCYDSISTRNRKWGQSVLKFLLKKQCP